MIDQEEILNNELENIQNTIDTSIHWISRQDLEILFEVCYLLGFENLYKKIYTLLNTIKVDISIGFQKELVIETFEYPDVEYLKKKYKIESQETYLNLFNSPNTDFYQLALKKDYQLGLSKCKSMHDTIEVYTIACLNNDFDKIERIQDEYLQNHLEIIKYIERNRAYDKMRDESPLCNIVNDKYALLGCQIVLALNSLKPWESYPLID